MNFPVAKIVSLLPVLLTLKKIWLGPISWIGDNLFVQRVSGG